MKVLLVITRADSVGGAQTHVLDLAIGLIQHGHEVLVAAGGRGTFTTMLDHASIPSVECTDLQREIRPVEDSRAFSQLRRIIQTFQPDLVSAHTSKAGLLSRLACRFPRIPCVVNPHGWAFAEGVPEPRRTVYRWLERGVAPLADQIICVSEHDRQLAVRAGIHPSKLVTIYNGVPDVHPSFRARAEIGNGPVRVVMVARFDQQKDHRTLLEAFHGIPGACLDLVGEGPNMAAVQAHATALGITDRVRFLGHRDDVAEILAQSQIFALISNWEGFPQSTIEAMRAGLPVVVSDVGGAAEAGIDGTTGYHVPRHEVAAVRDRLTRIVTDIQLREQMGRAARERYEECFTFERMFDRTVGVYRATLGERQPIDTERI